MTPEGKVKAKIKKFLDTLGEDVHYDMPVPGGYGKTTIDYIGCYIGRYFGIEAKRERKFPTPKQDAVMEKIRRAGGVTFAINDDVSLAVFVRWTQQVRSDQPVT